MKKLQGVKGTQDFFAEKQRLFTHVLECASNVANSFSYQEMSVPLLEHTEVFKRSLGEGSDIVHKEMYSFEDKKGRSLTLRPEFTASVVRSIISSGAQKQLPLKLFSHGPLFRYERPQKGRYRQFHQVNFEYIGSAHPMADAEIISAANQLLKKLELKNLTLEINSLGDYSTRTEYTKALVKYFSKHTKDLSEDSKVRLQKNPLRILDSKDSKDRELIANAPMISEFWNEESKKFFEQLLCYLDAMGIVYKRNYSLVRGLDYYAHTVFEFTTNDLGAQGTVLAGGRYDKLIKQMGGDDIPAVGFAAGIERLMELSKGKIQQDKSISIVLFAEEYLENGLKLSEELRSKEIRTELDVVKNMNKSMKKALDSNAKFIIFIGQEEASKGLYKIKDLDSRKEEMLNLSQLLNRVGSYEF